MASQIHLNANIYIHILELWVLFTYSGDRLLCQKLISPLDQNQFTGLCKILPSGYHREHQAQEKKKQHAGVESNTILVFYVAASNDHISLLQEGFWETSKLSCSKAIKIKWLICVLTLCYAITDARMHAAQLRHVCSCSLVR